jgi:hypothetical protein
MSFAFFLAAFTAWTGLTSENHLGGRKVSEGYLQGKVVLVQRWRGTDASSSRALERMERVWQSYKSKPFVLLGSYAGGEAGRAAAARAVKRLAVSCPVYCGAERAQDAPQSEKFPFYYVVDATGRVTFRGSDGRLAEMALENALTNLASPPNVRFWRRLIDHEIDVLPGRALLHLMEFRKRFPADAREYGDVLRRLRADPTVVQLAKLEAFARQAKDFDPKGKTAEMRWTAQKISRTIQAYAVLKKGSNPVHVQEAKNCLADLLWTEAALKARIGK